MSKKENMVTVGPKHPMSPQQRREVLSAARAYGRIDKDSSSGAPREDIKRPKSTLTAAMEAFGCMFNLPSATTPEGERVDLPLDHVMQMKKPGGKPLGEKRSGGARRQTPDQRATASAGRGRPRRNPEPGRRAADGADGANSAVYTATEKVSPAPKRPQQGTSARKPSNLSFPQKLKILAGLTGISATVGISLAAATATPIIVVLAIVLGLATGRTVEKRLLKVNYISRMEKVSLKELMDQIIKLDKKTETRSLWGKAKMIGRLATFPISIVAASIVPVLIETYIPSSTMAIDALGDFLPWVITVLPSLIIHINHHSRKAKRALAKAIFTKHMEHKSNRAEVASLVISAGGRYSINMFERLSGNEGNDLSHRWKALGHAREIDAYRNEDDGTIDPSKLQLKALELLSEEYDCIRQIVLDSITDWKLQEKLPLLLEALKLTANQPITENANKARVAEILTEPSMADHENLVLGRLQESDHNEVNLIIRARNLGSSSEDRELFAIALAEPNFDSIRDTAIANVGGGQQVQDVVRMLAQALTLCPTEGQPIAAIADKERLARILGDPAMEPHKAFIEYCFTSGDIDDISAMSKAFSLCQRWQSLDADQQTQQWESHLEEAQRIRQTLPASSNVLEQLNETITAMEALALSPKFQNILTNIQNQYWDYELADEVGSVLPAMTLQIQLMLALRDIRELRSLQQQPPQGLSSSNSEQIARGIRALEGFIRSSQTTLENGDLILSTDDGTRYLIFAELGHGQDTVYRAVGLSQTDFNIEKATNLDDPEKIVAIKRFERSEPEQQERFRQEAMLLQTLGTSRHIIGIMGIGVSKNGTPFYVMPYINSPTITELINVMKLHKRGVSQESPHAQRYKELDQLLGFDSNPNFWEPLLLQFCDALDGLHGQGIAHRDIKTGNAFVVLGPQEKGKKPAPEIRLSDLGISKSIGESDGPTRTRSVQPGTLNYMAPELEDKINFWPDDPITATSLETISGLLQLQPSELLDELRSTRISSGSGQLVTSKGRLSRVTKEQFVADFKPRRLTLTDSQKKTLYDQLFNLDKAYQEVLMPRLVKADLYAFGVLMYTVFNHDFPFNHNDDLAYSLWARQTPKEIAQGDIPDKYWPTIKRCLSHDPANRPESAAEVRYSLQRVVKPAMSTPKTLEEAKSVVAALNLEIANPVTAARKEEIRLLVMGMLSQDYVRSDVDFSMELVALSVKISGLALK